jgi:hypothetical protein
MHAPPETRKSSPWQGRANSQDRFAHEQQPAAREHLCISDEISNRQVCALRRCGFLFQPATARVVAGLCFDGGRS